MNPTGYYVFCLIMILCYVIARTNAYQKNKSENESKEFWARESKANTTRKKDISNLDFVVIPIESLPTKNLEKIDSFKCNALKNLSSEKIVNLSNHTNTDLKLMYGVANLEILSVYDENYTKLIVLLNEIGELLSDYPNDAKAFLEYSISIGSDIRTTYEMLANIYIDENDTASFNKLIENAENLTSISKSAIITKLHNIKSQTK